MRKDDDYGCEYHKTMVRKQQELLLLSFSLLEEEYRVRPFGASKTHMLGLDRKKANKYNCLL